MKRFNVVSLKRNLFNFNMMDDVGGKVSYSGGVFVLTSGGDAPGMNAVIHGIAAEVISLGWTLYGVRKGYCGLINWEIEKINFTKTSSFLKEAGSFLGSSRCLEFKKTEVREAVAQRLIKEGIRALIVIGGDGSYQGANLLSKLGVPVMTIPGTIDNDVPSTDYTVGFLSSLEEICGCVGKIRSTSNSHSQITFVEVMGRDCHDLTAFAGVASNVDLVITNINPLSLEQIKSKLLVNPRLKKTGIIILVSEKIYGDNFPFKLPELTYIAKQIETDLGVQTRVNVLGHAQRGAIPTCFEIFNGINFGKYAIQQIIKGSVNFAIGFNGKDFFCSKIEEAVMMKKQNRDELIKFQNNIFGLI